MYILFINSGGRWDIFFYAQFNNNSNKINKKLSNSWVQPDPTRSRVGLDPCDRLGWVEKSPQPNPCTSLGSAIIWGPHLYEVEVIGLNLVFSFLWPTSRGSTISWGPRLMKWRLLVWISLPPSPWDQNKLIWKKKVSLLVELEFTIIYVSLWCSQNHWGPRFFGFDDLQ